MSSTSPIAVPSSAKTAVTTQPKAENMKMKSLAPQNETQDSHTHSHGAAQRLRGGGAAKNVAKFVDKLLLKVIIWQLADTAFRDAASAPPTFSAARARCAARCLLPLSIPSFPA
ncbi:hypothetical protein DXG01_008039 [Tephrocybe rancida]|nr:hypothetical protein DXG01_008039 [Tephrocybe rancida]